jgi:hypothetical protein
MLYYDFIIYGSSESDIEDSFEIMSFARDFEQPCICISIALPLNSCGIKSGNIKISSFENM